jgi:excisionase family DNA binding protein
MWDVTDPDPVLNPHQVADILGCNYETVLRHLRGRTLDGVKRGNLWYIRQSAVDRFLASDHPHTDVA